MDGNNVIKYIERVVLPDMYAIAASTKSRYNERAIIAEDSVYEQVQVRESNCAHLPSPVQLLVSGYK